MLPNKTITTATTTPITIGLLSLHAWGSMYVSEIRHLCAVTDNKYIKFLLQNINRNAYTAVKVYHF